MKSSAFFSVLLDKSRDDQKLWEILFTTKAGFGWVYDTAILTGWGLDIIVVIMVICSMPFVRRSGHFQVRTTHAHMHERKVKDKLKIKKSL